ncbi:MAG: DMT family transporter [Prevotellaceae bacterium]|nr:DMT family transporter [Prevotella sp.]MDD7605567.1 DMT family transporter [Prevotellaceae bacterium]
MSKTTTGYILAAIAAASYGTNPLFALPLYSAGMNPDSVLFFRYLMALPLLAAMLIARGRGFGLRTNQVLPLMGMGVVMAVSSLTLFESYNYMAAGIASTLLFVYPIMVAVIMAIGFGERLQAQTIGCIVMALAGIALLYRGSDGATLSLTGTVMVVVSALSYAIYIVGANRPRLSAIPTLKITFYVLLFGVFVFGTRFVAGQPLTTPTIGQWYLWANVIALAVFPTAISFLCTTAAIQRIGSTPTAILGALEPATAIFFGITVFGETLTLRDSIGLALIITAVTLVVAGSKTAPYLMRLRRMFPRLLHRHGSHRQG